MPIDDVDTPFSPGWWMKRLAGKQADRWRDLDKLTRRYNSDPPLPEGARQARPAYEAFQRLARTNYEESIVQAVLHRQTPTGFRTAKKRDDAGDDVAAALWAANQGPLLASTLLEHKLVRREGYAIIGPPDDDSDGNAVITAEDPREVIAAVDPVRPTKTRAALKTFWDPDLEKDIAYLYLAAGVTLPGGGTSTRASVHRAVKQGRQVRSTLGTSLRLSPRSWDWEPDPAWNGREVLELPTRRCPVVRFLNRGGVGEFEKHVDLIDRIRHTILQRMVVVTLQAFRQRAVSGLPDRYPNDWPEVEKRGQPIDYSDILTADPAAVWLLPALLDAEGKRQIPQIWESGALDLTPILSAVKDDIRELAATTFTTFYTFMPDGANQTAEGASTMREGLVFKVSDHNDRDGIALAQTMSIAFEIMGDTDRAPVGQLDTLWGPIERYGLAEKAAAAVQAKAAGRTRRAILTDIWQLTPAQAQRELDDSADDFLMGAQSTSIDPTQVALHIASTRVGQQQPGGGVPQPQLRPAIGQGATTSPPVP